MITAVSFLSFYPQFSCFANGAVLPEYLRQANARFGDFGEDADEARRLYAAHKLTLYSASTPPGNVAPAPAGEEPTTAGGGSFVGSEVIRKGVGSTVWSNESYAVKGIFILECFVNYHLKVITWLDCHKLPL